MGPRGGLRSCPTRQVFLASADSTQVGLSPSPPGLERWSGGLGMALAGPGGRRRGGTWPAAGGAQRDRSGAVAMARAGLAWPATDREQKVDAISWPISFAGRQAVGMVAPGAPDPGLFATGPGAMDWITGPPAGGSDSLGSIILLAKISVPAGQSPRVASRIAWSTLRAGGRAQLACTDREPCSRTRVVGGRASPARTGCRPADPMPARHRIWGRPGPSRLGPSARPHPEDERRGGSKHSGWGLWVGKVGGNEQGHGVARRPRSGGSGPISAGAPVGGRWLWLTPRWWKRTMQIP